MLEEYSAACTLLCSGLKTPVECANGYPSSPIDQSTYGGFKPKLEGTKETVNMPVKCENILQRMYVRALQLSSDLWISERREDGPRIGCLCVLDRE